MHPCIWDRPRGNSSPRLRSPCPPFTPSSSSATAVPTRRSTPDNPGRPPGHARRLPFPRRSENSPLRTGTRAPCRPRVGGASAMEALRFLLLLVVAGTAVGSIRHGRSRGFSFRGSHQDDYLGNRYDSNATAIGAERKISLLTGFFRSSLFFLFIKWHTVLLEVVV